MVVIAGLSTAAGTTIRIFSMKIKILFFQVFIHEKSKTASSATHPYSLCRTDTSTAAY
jgi:hypothetical protein